MKEKIIWGMVGVIFAICIAVGLTGVAVRVYGNVQMKKNARTINIPEIQVPASATPQAEDLDSQEETELLPEKEETELLPEKEETKKLEKSEQSKDVWQTKGDENQSLGNEQASLVAKTQESQQASGVGEASGKQQTSEASEVKGKQQASGASEASQSQQANGNQSQNVSQQTRESQTQNENQSQSQSQPSSENQPGNIPQQTIVEPAPIIEVDNTVSGNYELPFVPAD